MVALDTVDRQLAHALQLDGRASFSTIAAVLGVSDQTVARRYRRLRSAGALRVVGLPNARRLGHVEWLVRLRCMPDAAGPIAEALARRENTSWVGLTSGGAEIVCVLRSRSPAERNALLLGQLPHTPRVVAVTAHLLLRTFFGGATGWNGRADALTPDQIEALRPEPAEPGGEPVRLGDGDEALLAELALDGRASLQRLAAACGRSESTVQRRLEHLRARGALFFDVEIEPGLLGFSGEGWLWLSVAPRDLVSVATAMAGHPEIAFVAATTGSANLVASLGVRDVDQLFDYVAGPLAALDAIRDLESAPVMRTVKRAGLLLH
nr:Lrp/AsnC family transcriptional regulator [Amycolatopsis anabasis]